MEELFVSPEDPSEAGVDKSELVARSVDRDDARDVKCPFEVRIREWRDKSTRCCVNVDLNVESLFFLQLIHCIYAVARFASRIQRRRIHVRRSLISCTFSKCPVYVEPMITITPIVFSSMYWIASGGCMMKSVSACTGTRRASTSQ